MSESAKLHRILGRRDVLGLAFGAMVGWGWVVLSGEMIDRAGTLGSVFAFLLGAAMVLLVGLIYAELTSAISREGGELAFTFVGMGPKVSFLCGWALVLAYFSVCAFEAVALPTVASYILPDIQIGRLYAVQGTDVYITWVVIGAAGSLAIGLVNYFGVKPASFLQWAIVLDWSAAGGILGVLMARRLTAQEKESSWPGD